MEPAAESAYPYPAAGSTYPSPPSALANPNPNHVWVLNPYYCCPYPVELAIVRKVLCLTEGTFAVTDVNGNIMFKIQGKFMSIRDRRTLLDAAENPICILRPKVLFFFPFFFFLFF